MTLAQDLNPKVWEEYFGFTNMVNRFKKSIIDDTNPGAIFISSATGVGKTAISCLYIKSVLCLNREADEYNPCGHCENCMSDPRIHDYDGNVIWVQRGSGDTITSQVNLAVEAAYTPAIPLSMAKPGRKFIVFDEVQSIPKDKLSEVLFLSEIGDIATRNNITFIFITMDEKSINENICKALKSRCGSFYFKLPTPNKSQISEYILSKFPLLNIESVEIMAAYSFSYRSVLQTYEMCSKSCVNLEPSSISGFLGFADKSIRKRLWEILQSCTQDNYMNYKTFKEFWDLLITQVDEDILLNQLEEDVDKSLCSKPHPNQLIALDVLLMHKVKENITLQQSLRSLMGLPIIDFNIFN